MTRGMERLQAQLVACVEASTHGRSERIPEAGSLLWGFFLELTEARFEDRPLSFSEIDAWSRLTGNPLAPHHVRILRAMDFALLAAIRERAKAEAERAATR